MATKHRTHGPGRTTAALRTCLRHRHLPWFAAVLAMVLCAPSLRLGWQLDDHFHRLALTRPDLPMLSRSPAELFAFIRGDEAYHRQAVAMGMLPWWSHERLCIAFYRPVTGWSHWLDYRLWPNRAALMHLHSLVWFGGAVVAAGFLYRRVLGATAVAGLATLLFAVDDAHGMPVVWLANRNALLGMFFGLLALAAHDRWRKGGSWLAAIVAPGLLVLGLLSKESTVAVVGYLAAYALFLDRGTWLRRVGSLLPCLVTCGVWWVLYRQHGCATTGSGWYLDPGTGLVQFVRALADRATALLAWQWLVPTDLEWALSPKTAHVLWLATSGFLLAVAVALVAVLRRDRVARFWALGMMLSLVPACTAYPDARLLCFVGIGAMGLLAQLVTAVWQAGRRAQPSCWRRLPVQVLCAVMVIVHLGVAPVTLAGAADSLGRLGGTARRPAASLPADPQAVFQTTLVVNTPSYSTFGYCVLMRLLEDRPYLSRTLVLGSGGQPIEVHRPDSRTVVLRPEGGFLGHLGGRGASGELERLLFDQRCVIHSLDRLYRDATPMAVGQRIALTGVTVEITATTDDGRPAEAAFRFAFALENPLFRWLQWDDGMYVPFTPPAVGETVTLPAARLPFDNVRSSSEPPRPAYEPG